MATVETVPELALPNKLLQLAFTPTSGGNFVKVWCTAAPRGSKLREQLDKQQVERVLVVAESDIDKRPQLSFDKGGVYALQVEEFTKGAENYGGRYRGDPDGFRTETRLNATSATVSIASLLEVEIGVRPDTATLQLYVQDDDIVATTIASHGVASPAIVRPQTDKALHAVDAEAVVAALTGLSGLSATEALGDLPALVSDFITKFNGHRIDLTFHETADNYQLIPEAYRNPTSPTALRRALGECLRQFASHVQNVDDDPEGTNGHGPGSAGYHVDGAADWTSLPLASGGQHMSDSWMLGADLWRCYTQHLTSSVHKEADTVYTLSEPLPPFGVLLAAFLAEIAILTPEAASNEHAALPFLVADGGFKRVL